VNLDYAAQPHDRHLSRVPIVGRPQ
jgi:hypothetical protein